MDINTGKLASHSSNLFKKIKENDTNQKTSQVKNKEYNLHDVIQKNLKTVANQNNDYKNRITQIQKQVQTYENELSQTQYIDQQLTKIQDLLTKNQKDKAEEIIDISKFNGKKILNSFFKDRTNLNEELAKAQQEITEKFNELNLQYNLISVTSQNIVSNYSTPLKDTNEMIKNLNHADLMNSTKLNNRRILDLIS